jgi:transmembrane sensor
MSGRIVAFPDKSVIERQAWAWLVRLDGDEPLTPEEQDAFREWLGRSPDHKKELLTLVQLWGRMNVLTELAVPLGRTPAQAPSAGDRKPIALWLRPGLLAAAAILLSLSAVYYDRMERGPDGPHQVEFTTRIGERLETQLADGTLLTLNTRSRVSVEFGSRFRDVRLLEGEAHFDVVTDPDRPFRVIARNGLAQAVGTAFSVYLKDGVVNVTVTEGRVALGSIDRANRTDREIRLDDVARGAPEGATRPSGIARQFALLEAGQSATFGASDDPASEFASTRHIIQNIEAGELERRLSWRQGMLVFSGDPLEQVIEEISRYTTLSIEITDPAVKAIRIGGQFSIGETEAMLMALETNFGLRISRVAPDQILISSAEYQ